MTKAEKLLSKMTEKQLSDAYCMALRRWIAGGRTDATLLAVTVSLECEMDSRGMDTEAVIDLALDAA